MTNCMTRIRFLKFRGTRDARPDNMAMDQRLPHDLLLSVAANLGPAALLVLSQVSRACNDAANAPQLWRKLLECELKAQAHLFFGGTLPPPSASVGWKRHFFVLRRSWKQLAQEKTGRLLVQIGACALRLAFAPSSSLNPCFSLAVSLRHATAEQPHASDADLPMGRIRRDDQWCL